MEVESMQMQVDFDTDKKMDRTVSADESNPAQLRIDDAGLRRSFASYVKHWIREPLVQFLLIGAVLFAVYSALNRDSNQVQVPKQIDLTWDDLRQLEVGFTAKWQRPPTREEFANLVEDRISEEVLYREALALGLDKDDTILKRRMAQKMRFIADDVSAAREPKTEELKAWFGKNGQRFALPPRVSFRHIYFSPDRRVSHTREDAEHALQGLISKPGDSRDVSKLGDPFMFQDYYSDRSPEQIGKDFGLSFARALFQLQTDSWQGPVESGYGWHLINIDSLTPGRVPQFEEVERDVKAAWIAEQRAEYWNKSYEAMRKKYTVFLPQPPEETATSSDKKKQ